MKALDLTRDTGEIIAEFKRSQHAFALARRALHEHIDSLRQAIENLAEELSSDAVEAALLAVVAVHRGDADTAYVMARAAAQCHHASQSAFALVCGEPA